MGTSLAGLLPQNTYSGLLKFGDNAALSATLRAISDGAGNDTMLSISTTALQIGGATGLNWDNTNKRLGIGTNAPNTALDISASLTSIFTLRNGATNFITTRSSGIAGVDTGLRIWENSNNFTLDLYGSGSYDHPQRHRFYIGGAAGERFLIGSSTAATIKGSGSTSATTSLLVQNSGGNTGFEIKDDRSFVIGNFGANGAGFGILAGNPTGAGVGGGINFNFNNGAAFNDDTNNSALKMTYNGGVRIPNSSRYPLTLGSDTKAVASAQLEMVSTTQGFLPPRMTTTQKNAIASPATGLEMYDSTAKSPAYYDGTNWGYTGGALQNTTGNGGTLNVSFAAGNIVNLTLNATTTLTFANAVIGTYIVQVTQSAGGGSSLVYPASVKWAGGTAPTLSTAVGKTDILTFYHDGTNYYGTYSLNY